MIPARFESLLFSFLLSVFMSCLSTFVAIHTAVGFSEGFLLLWMSAWGNSWAVSFPILLLITPYVRRLTVKLIVSPADQLDYTAVFFTFQVCIQFRGQNKISVLVKFVSYLSGLVVFFYYFLGMIYCIIVDRYDIS